MRLLLLLLLCFGCCERPWKTLYKPAMVEWKDGSGDLWLARDESFALLFTDRDITHGETFLYRHKVFCVVNECGRSDRKFLYILKVKQ